MVDKMQRKPSKLQMALAKKEPNAGHVKDNPHSSNNNPSPTRLAQSIALDYEQRRQHELMFQQQHQHANAQSLNTTLFHNAMNQNERGCYVCEEVTIEQVDDEQSRVQLVGLVHFFWVQDAMNPDTKQLVIDSSTAQPIRGAELLFHLQERTGITIQSKLANRVVLLDPINDDRCTMPLPSRRSKPLALFKGMRGDVSVDRVLFYPDYGVMHLSYRYSGWITQVMPTFRFPFDRQAVKLELLTRDCPPVSLFDPIGDGRPTRLVASPPPSLLAYYASLLDESQARLVSPTDVRIGARIASTWELGPDPQHLACLDFSRRGACSLPTLVLPLQRKNHGIFQRIVFPAWVIQLFASASFAIDPEDSLFQRIALVALGLASVLLLRFGVAQTIPRFPTTTLLDLYFMACYVMLVIMAVLNIVVVLSASASADASTETLGDRTADASCWVILMLPWTAVHVLVFLLRNSDILRGNWKTLVTAAKLNHMTGLAEGNNRVFPLQQQELASSLLTVDALRPHDFQPQWWMLNQPNTSSVNPDLPAYSRTLPTRWTRGNDDRVLERLAAGVDISRIATGGSYNNDNPKVMFDGAILGHSNLPVFPASPIHGAQSWQRGSPHRLPPQLSPLPRARQEAGTGATSPSSTSTNTLERVAQNHNMNSRTNSPKRNNNSSSSRSVLGSAMK